MKRSDLIIRLEEIRDFIGGKINSSPIAACVVCFVLGAVSFKFQSAIVPILLLAVICLGFLWVIAEVEDDDDTVSSKSSSVNGKASSNHP